MSGAVDLDDEQPLGPVEVHLLVTQMGVDERLREAAVDAAQKRVRGVLPVPAEPLR